MNPPPVAICYIVDVGVHAGGHSGSSNVIIFPHSRNPKYPCAVVIDCGDQPQTTIRLLQERKVSRIEHVFITHNDWDHAGGIIELVNAFRGQTGKVWLLQDRPAPNISYFPELQRLQEAGHIEKIKWLQRDEESPQILHRQSSLNRDDSGAWTIHLLYPLSVGDTLDPQISKDPNAASAVLLLECGEGDRRGRMLFPGDAQIDSMERAQEYFSGPEKPARPILCDILVAPHHGGAVRRGGRMRREQYDTLFREVVKCRFGVVSVATHNHDGHPHEEHILALSAASESVLCTQITRKCCHDPRSQPGILAPEAGIPQASDSDKGTACAGTVVVDMGPFPLEPRRWTTHRDSVNRLHRVATTAGLPIPLCRRQTAT
ncbi:MAG: ComEC/Rec2 family competence protein [Isosphaeraceae bacterium]